MSHSMLRACSILTGKAIGIEGSQAGECNPQTDDNHLGRSLLQKGGHQAVCWQVDCKREDATPVIRWTCTIACLFLIIDKK